MLSPPVTPLHVGDAVLGSHDECPEPAKPCLRGGGEPSVRARVALPLAVIACYTKTLAERDGPCSVRWLSLRTSITLVTQRASTRQNIERLDPPF